MSGLTLRDIREALATQIRDAVAEPTNVYAYRVDNPQPPYIIVDPDAEYLDYFAGGTFGSAGMSKARFSLEINPASNDTESAGIALDDYLSAGTGNPSSVIDAIMANPTLGLTGCTVHEFGVLVDPLAVTARLSFSFTISNVGRQA